ncbi:phosphate acetyltransferase [Buchnera aphidicola (Cinara tujafilina)]|uniref:Phosphate acetyltransferase n=1 Tax=Buchnera aphidicola (Cinara tujafilina) TaxID=261317 RepID=F7WZ56_9GAMM|nr:phosphate acetyltransferase [Buchnera aphidicola]AEH39710.1 phosphate acetyltransferase [Buchnera aphidicola (Cinara tujafilina)]
MKNYAFNFKNFLIKKASKNVKNIVIPECNNIKILKAVSICINLKISRCILLGNHQDIYQLANKYGILLDNTLITILDPCLIRKNYIELFLKLYGKKNINDDIASKLLENNILLAIMMLYKNDADGMVAGISCSTGYLIRSILRIFKSSIPDIFISSVFFMLFPDKVLIYGDCAINLDPNTEQLVKIAEQSLKTAKLVKIEPRIAFLSYSTHDSGIGSSVEKIRKTTKLMKILYPNLIIDGPLQYDAAINTKIARIKSPTSSICGRATILIFPDLNSGNITYKAVQQSAKIISIGPILQGLLKPVNDLSRGASVDDIVYTIAVTVIQAQ